MRASVALLCVAVASGCAGRKDHRDIDEGSKVVVEPKLDQKTLEAVKRGEIASQVQFGAMNRDLFWSRSPGDEDVVWFEPLMQPELTVALKERRVCVTLQLDDIGYKVQVYRAAERAAARRANPSNRSLHPLRLPVFNLSMSLSPAGEQKAFNWAPVQQRLGEVREPPKFCFSVPVDAEADLKRLEGAEVSIHYSFVQEEATGAACSLMIRASNNGTFSQTLKGAGRGTQSVKDEVYITRNQLAKLVTEQKLSLSQSCVSAAAAGGERTLAGQSLERMLPLVEQNLATQRVAWSDAVKALASYDFPGSDAGTKINSWVDRLNEKIRTEDEVKLKSSANFEFFDLLKAGADNEGSYKWVRDNQKDMSFEWQGTKIVPASLDVVVLRGTETSMKVKLSAAETTFLPDRILTRSFLAKVSSPVLGKKCEWTGTKVFVDGDEVMCDTLETAPGTVIRIENGGRIVIWANSIVFGDGTKFDGRGTVGAKGGRGADGQPREWASQCKNPDSGNLSEDYRDAVNRCRTITSSCAEANYGRRGLDGAPGGKGAEVVMSVRWTSRGGTLSRDFKGGEGGPGGDPGSGTLLKNGCNYYVDGGQVGAANYGQGSQGPKGSDGGIKFLDW